MQAYLERRVVDEGVSYVTRMSI